MNQNINISSIEKFFYNAINGVVSSNTFVGILPDTIQKSWTDMCLIDCGTRISDMGAMGRGRVLIWLYAKPLSDGSKNVKAMEALESSLNTVIDSCSTDTFVVERDTVYTDFDSDRKWHVNIVSLILKIF